ncbi:ATP-binding cassette domain-containing protein [Paenibacillus sp. 28ISP30-2]|nr:ATP-binding cassette domain-containing protein [Paenibacillus sp. 28ISP30-2]
MPSITLNQLSKTVTYYKKEPGVRKSLQNRFRREKLTKEAVRDVSFTIEEGEIVGFLGRNGPGKTKTSKIMSGILQPGDGGAPLHGLTPWKRQRDFKRKFPTVWGRKS